MGNKHKPKRRKLANLKRLRDHAKDIRNKKATLTVLANKKSIPKRANSVWEIGSNPQTEHEPAESVFTYLDLDHQNVPPTNSCSVIVHETNMVANASTTSHSANASGPSQELEDMMESEIQILEADKEYTRVVAEAPQTSKENMANTEKYRKTGIKKKLKRLNVQQKEDLNLSKMSVRSLFNTSIANISTENVKQNPGISGHRIIDVNHFFGELAQVSKHDSLFRCGLDTIKIVSENSCGLQSNFILSCLMCKKEFKIRSTSQNVNKNAVAGAMVAGCGHAQLKQISASLDLPIMSDKIYKVAHDDICSDWEATSWEEMKKAGEKEKAAAIEEGKVDKNGNAMIDVILDGCWCKHSYKTNYSALSGAATIIGRRFGQVLFMSVKNKYCCICARAEKKKQTVKEHKCFKNFSGSSTAMESSIIVEGFKQSIDMHGLIYSRFIADGDSSTYSKILEARPYPGITVEKISCKNHILRNFCNKLQNLKTDTKYKSTERKLLTSDKILSARRYICKAMEYHGKAKENISENIKNLHKDVTVSIYHAFGNHNSCNKYFCDKTTQEDLKTLMSTTFWLKMRFITTNVANHARSLIENVESNAVERFNGVIAKFVGGKRVNYALRGSYQARCAGAVISFNTGKILTTVNKNIYSQSPSAKCKQLEESIVKKRKYNNTLKRKKNRNMISKKIDFNYGENADQPDLDPESFEQAKIRHLDDLKKIAEERDQIQERTILQSACGEWLELRRNLLTASNFGRVYKRRVINSCASTVKSMLYKRNIEHVASVDHGKRNEKDALDELASLLGVEIEKCGLFIDTKHPFLGATPDGIIDDDTLVEIKCPIAPTKIGIDAAIKTGKMHFWRVNKKTSEIYINTNSDWYIQVQGQLQICQKSKCILGVWYGTNKIKTEVIYKDDAFWAKVEPKLIQFYMDCLLPELVDPRVTRNKSIREPDYVVIKEKKTTNKENIAEIQEEVQEEIQIENNVHIEGEVREIRTTTANCGTHNTHRALGFNHF